MAGTTATVTGSRAAGSVPWNSRIRRSRVAGRVQAARGTQGAVRSRTNESAPVHASAMGVLRVALEPVERVKQLRPEFKKLRVQKTPYSHVQI